MLDQLRVARKKLITAIDTYPSKLEDTVFYGTWTIKEVVAHLAAWDRYFTHVIKAHSQGNVINHWGNINQFNAREVKKRENDTFDQVKQEFRTASQYFIATYVSLDQEKIDSKIWPSRTYTPQKILIIQLHHYQGQFNQIQKRSK
jgi:uncharacterized damage-inducible protein DinB